MVHDLDPVLWHIYGDIGVRWYGLSYILGFIAAFLMMAWLSRRQNMGLTMDMVSDLITYIALGTIIGGRLGYVFFYSPDLITKFKSGFPYWGVLAVNEGGMASHGGMIGVVIACLLFARRSGINTLYLFDLCSVSAPIGIFFGRIANFINGELVGRPAPPDLQWAVKFPQDMYLWPKNEPQKLEGLSAVVDKMGITASQWLDWVSQMKTDPTAREHVLSGVQKIITEIQAGNTAVKEALAPMLIPRHPSQLYAALLEGVLVFFFLFLLWRRPRRPGFISGMFLILYGIVRIIDEHYRMPDDHIGLQIFELTRGQILSIIMVVLGIILSFVWLRSSAIVVQGWGRSRGIKLGRTKR